MNDLRAGLTAYVVRGFAIVEVEIDAKAVAYVGRLWRCWSKELIVTFVYKLSVCSPLYLGSPLESVTKPPMRWLLWLLKSFIGVIESQFCCKC